MLDLLVPQFTSGIAEMGVKRLTIVSWTRLHGSMQGGQQLGNKGDSRM